MKQLSPHFASFDTILLFLAIRYYEYFWYGTKYYRVGQLMSLSPQRCQRNQLVTDLGGGKYKDQGGADHE